LVLLLGGAGKRRAWVILGFLAAAICLVSVAAIGVALGAWLDPAVVGYLGLAPLSLGLYGLYRQYLGQSAELAVGQPGTGELNVGLGSFTLMLGNSGDSLAVFLPLLAESSRESLLLVIACYLLAALAWSGLSLGIAGREVLARRIERSGSRLVPWVLILVGTYILLDTATDTLL
jgi:cadmium resistance protein CadD (predicted permease)